MYLPQEKYLSHDYIQSNPTWDCEDGPWKASYIADILRKKELIPTSICGVCCGSGRVLLELRRVYPEAAIYGYDIAPAAATFWGEYEKNGHPLPCWRFLKDEYDELFIS